MKIGNLVNLNEKDFIYEFCLYSNIIQITLGSNVFVQSDQDYDIFIKKCNYKQLFNALELIQMQNFSFHKIFKEYFCMKIGTKECTEPVLSIQLIFRYFGSYEFNDYIKTLNEIIDTLESKIQIRKYHVRITEFNFITK